MTRQTPPALFRATMLFLMIVSLAATGAAVELSTRIDEFMTSYHELGLFNGTALIATGGEVVLSKGYGLANMEWGIANHPDTRFRIGSITKQFTSMLVMQLVEEGELSLDARVGELLPAYRSDTGGMITVHHLLSHTSGVPNYNTQPEFMTEVSRNPYAVGEFVASHCSGDLEFEPGSTFRYSNSGYFLLGAIIEQVAGMPYEQVLRERILEPLGMHDTGYDHSDAIIERRASGYESTPGGYRNAAYIDMSLPYAAGALYSTVEDLHRWDRALYADALLSARWMAKMFEPVLSSYGYGWSIRQLPIGPEEATRTVIAHGGGINGFNTVIARVTDDRHLVVLLNNTGDARLGEMQSGILDLVYGREPTPTKPSVVQALTETVATGGVTAAVARYRELKAQHADEYDFDEDQLNGLGYQLLGAGDVDGAIEVFTLNVEMYPEASNPYDSLAEAYMAAGTTVEAIVNYARSLELDPGNTWAVRQLMVLSGVAEQRR